MYKTTPKIISDYTRYNKALGILVLILGFLLFCFYDSTSNKRKYHVLNGNIEKIAIGHYLDGRTSRFKFREDSVQKEAIEITVNSELFYIDENERDKWLEILQKVKFGDQVVLTYYGAEDVRINNVHGLEVDGEEILTTEKRNRPMVFIKIGAIIVFVAALISLILLILKRRKFVHLSRKKY